MKNLTKFKKQIIGICAVALAAAVLFGLYAIFAEDDQDAGSANTRVELNYSFNVEEKAALEAFAASVKIKFAAEKGKADEQTAPLMKLAADYAALNKNITLSFGNGGEDCVVERLSGDDVKKTVIKIADLEYFYNPNSETPTDNPKGAMYAIGGIKCAFNQAIFGEALGRAKDEKLAMTGFDIYGNTLNAGGNIVMFSLGKGYADLAFVQISNRHNDEITFYTSKETGSPTIIGAGGMEINTVSAVMLMSFAQTPTAVGIVENPEALSVYGLDSDENALATVLVSVDEKNFRRIRIGKALPDGSGHYALCDDKNNDYKPTVYKTTSYSSYALMSMESYLTASYGIKLETNTDIYSVVDDMSVSFGEETVKLKKLSDEEKKDLALDYTWKVTAPDRFIHSEKGYALCNYFNVGDLFTALSGLATTNIVKAVPDEEALAEYGLAEPFRSYKWTVKMSDGKVICSVSVSKPDKDGNFYVCGTKQYLTKDGKEYTETLGIGTLTTSDFCNEDGVGYISYSALDFVDNKLFTDFITAVDSITITKDGETHVFDLDKSVDGKIAKARLDGKVVDLQSVRRMYVDIIHPVILGEYQGEVPDAETIRITLTRSGEDTVLSFTRLNSVQVYCTVNGGGNYYVNYDDVKAIIDDYETLISGGKVER